jgi:hypothetical protein
MVFEHFRVEGNKGNNTFGHGIEHSCGIDNTYRDVSIFNSPERGFYIHSELPSYACEVVNIDNCYVAWSQKAGIYVQTVGDLHISGSTFEVTQLAGFANLDLRAAFRATIVGGYTERNVAGVIGMNLSACSATVIGGTYYGPIRINNDQGSMLQNVMCRTGNETPITITNSSSSTSTIITGGAYDITPCISIDNASFTTKAINVPNFHNTDSDLEYLAGGVTSKLVNHSLGRVPTKFSIIPRMNSLGNASAWFVTNITAASFILNRAYTLDWEYIQWYVEVYT